MGAVEVETFHEAKPSLLQIKLDKICFHLSAYRQAKVSLVGQDQGKLEGMSYKTRRQERRKEHQLCETHYCTSSKACPTP